jgi:hypothetical protein
MDFGERLKLLNQFASELKHGSLSNALEAFVMSLPIKEEKKDASDRGTVQPQ